MDVRTLLSSISDAVANLTPLDEEDEEQDPEDEDRMMDAVLFLHESPDEIIDDFDNGILVLKFGKITITLKATIS